MNDGMVFDIYKIKSAALAPYIQYILFNYCDNKSYSQVITSFANTNICLGIMKEQELVERADGVKYGQYKSGIHAYLSGMYLQPHKFEVQGLLDEICIDFTPLGYYRFFKFAARTYVFGEDMLREGFGKSAEGFFERIFEKKDFQERGALIEAYLLTKMIATDATFVAACLYHIDRWAGAITLKALAVHMQCSEKKIVRAFQAHFDLTPKDYIRIVKFRKALGTLNVNDRGSLTSIGYDSNYYDQSHFIKDFRFFTEKTPGQIKDTLLDVKENVIIGVE